MDAVAAEDPAQVGPYRIVGRLGVGSLGRVYLGRLDDGTLAAVRLVHAALGGFPEFRERFTAVADAAARVAGAATADVLDADAGGTRVWVATRFVAGPGLDEAVQAAGPLPEPTVWWLAAGLVDGLAAVHEAGLAHGDLKPGNVLLTLEGPRLIDYGFTQTLAMPALTSPEQAQGQPAQPASDVFAFGAVLASALTGVEPFGTGPAETVRTRVSSGVPDLTGIRGELLHLIEECLAKHPADRPPLASLRSRIGNHLSDGRRWPEAVVGLIGERERTARDLSLRATPFSERQTVVGVQPQPQSQPRPWMPPDSASSGAQPSGLPTQPSGPPRQPPGTPLPAAASAVPLPPPGIPGPTPPLRRRRSRALVGGVAAGLVAVLVVAGLAAFALTRDNGGSGRPKGGKAGPSRVAAAAPSARPVCGKSIGVIGYLSDPDDANYSVGADGYHGVEAAVDAYNREHADCPVSLRTADTKGQVAPARSGATTLVQDPNVVGVVDVGELTTAVTTGAVFNRAGIPFMVAKATSSTLARNGWKTFHRTIVSDGVQGPIAARFFASRQRERVFLVGDENPYSKGLTARARGSLGAAVVGTATLTGYADVPKVAAQIKASHADGVFLTGWYWGYGAMLVKSLGVTAGRDVVIDDALANSAFSAAAGGPGTKAYCTVLARSTAALPNSLVIAFDTKFGTAPTAWFVGEGYLGAQVLLHGLAAGKSSRAEMEAFADAFHGDADSASIAFDSDGNLSPANGWIFERSGAGWAPFAFY